MKKEKALYLLSPKIKWSTFKLLQRELVRIGGPSPKEIDRILWELLRDGKIYCGFRNDMEGDMWIGTKIPKGFKLLVIKNP